MSDGLHEFLQRCNVPKLAVSTDYEIFPLPPGPTIFVSSVTRNVRLKSKGSRTNLIQNFGSQLVHLTSSNSYSQGYRHMSFRDYLTTFTGPEGEFSCDLSAKGTDADCRAHIARQSNESLYLFGGNYDGVIQQLSDEYVVPPCRDCDRAGARSVGVAGPMSGVGFHYHGPGFSEPIIGRKLWILLPGTDFPPGFTANMTVVNWLGTVYPAMSEKERNELGLQQCTISPGEILFFPGMYMHATLNIDNYNLFVSLFLDIQLMSS